MRRSEGNRFSIGLTWPARVSALLGLFLLLIPAAWAQLPQAGDTTSPPTPGVGHDYIHSPVETVNPANGSVSIRVPVRIPSGRELTLPLSIAYDSSGAFYVAEVGGGGQPGLKATASAYFSAGGWSYTFPLTTSQSGSWTTQSSNGKNLTCTEHVNYVFQDSTGNRHNLGLALNSSAPAILQYCGGPDNISPGGEGPILAQLGAGTTAVVTDGNGTVYQYAGNNSQGTNYWSITDRNGNALTLAVSGVDNTASASLTDTLGRTAASVGSFGGNPDTLAVAGLSSPYRVYWTTASAHFTDDMTDLDAGQSGDGGCPTSMSASAQAVSQIVLPNGQKYTFSYDPTYGTLSKITYPSGGYVRYVWGVNSQAEGCTGYFS